MASSRRSGTNEQVSTYGNVTRNYTSLATWEDATDTDLVTATQSQALECYADSASYDDYVSLAGATTSASYFRIIRPASGQGHSGTPAGGIRFFSTADADCIAVSENNSQIQDVTVKVTNNSTTGRRGIFLNATGNAAVGCFAADSANAGSGANAGLATGSSASGSGFINCLAHNNDNQGFILNSAASVTVFAYNCTATNNATYGFFMAGTSGTRLVTNCVGADNTTADFYQSGTGATYTVTYCASKDATANDWSATGTRVSQTFSFVASASDDFRLLRTDAGAKSFGTPLSADGTFAFDDDIDIKRRIRRNTWDMGIHSCLETSAIMALQRMRRVA